MGVDLSKIPGLMTAAEVDAMRRKAGPLTIETEAKTAKAVSLRACSVCGNEFAPRQSGGGRWTKRCSRKCGWLATHRAVEVTCAHCARIFTRTQGHARRQAKHFCNHVCQGKYLRGENHYAYRGGHDPNRGPGWLALAERIRVRDGFVCQRCTRTQKENGRKLSVDHIRPWRSFADKALANDPSNLTSLCMRCHNHKTAAIEAAWLRGDMLGMQQYEQALSIGRDVNGAELRRRNG